ncbi:MAG: hypothetical protein KDA57_21590 [Planctomycetales bacterium]|nr:hypothetical protein [Planctomycetales bacterium]
MRLQRVSAYKVDGEGQSTKVVVWVGSQAEAATTRKTLVADSGYQRKDIDTTEVDVPTDKKGLLAFLNAL